MKKRILIVDDDQSIRDSLQKVLNEAGYDVVLAAGGLEAALRFEPDQIDLLLLDLNLPNQSGWDVFTELTERHPVLPVVIITGMPNQHRAALKAGVGALFEKPVEVPTLLSTLERLLAEPVPVRLHRLCGHRHDTRFVRRTHRFTNAHQAVSAPLEPAPVTAEPSTDDHAWQTHED